MDAEARNYFYFKSPNKNYDKDVAALKKHFEDAKSYGEQTERVTNLKLEKMQGLFDGSITLMIHASGPKEIIEGVNLAKEQGVELNFVENGIIVFDSRAIDNARESC